MAEDASGTASLGGGQFPATHWSMVLLAVQNSQDPQARAALARLCEMYWAPLYRFVRRSGYSRADAQDLTQAFFERLLERHSLGVADPARGSFRNFLLGLLRHFLCSEWHKANAQKRAPTGKLLSFNADTAEAYFAQEPPDPSASPEKIYERDGAKALIGKAIANLRARYQAKDKLSWYKALKPALMGEEAAPAYRELAGRLNTTEVAPRVEASRMRKALNRVLRHELKLQVGSPAEVEAEIRHLFEVLSS